MISRQFTIASKFYDIEKHDLTRLLNQFTTVEVASQIRATTAAICQGSEFLKMEKPYQIDRKWH